jgi:hypothetical protein
MAIVFAIFLYEKSCFKESFKYEVIWNATPCNLVYRYQLTLKEKTEGFSNTLVTMYPHTTRRHTLKTVIFIPLSSAPRYSPSLTSILTWCSYLFKWSLALRLSNRTLCPILTSSTFTACLTHMVYLYLII